MFIKKKYHPRFVNTRKKKATSETVRCAYRCHYSLIDEYIDSLSKEELLEASYKLSAGVWDTNLLGEYPDIPGFAEALFWAIHVRFGAYKIHEYSFLMNEKTKEDFLRYAVELLFNEEYNKTHNIPIDVQL